MGNNQLTIERVNWIDWLKAIGITFVIMGHLPFADSFINQFIYSFHMPLFFIISGYLFKPSGNFLSKNVKALLAPYFIYCLVNYVWWFIFSFLRHPEIYDFSFKTGGLKPFIGILLGIDYETIYSYPIPGPLWFLIAMFWVRIIANYFLNKINKYSFLVYISCLFSFAVFLLYVWGIDLWFSLDSAMLAFPFFVMGLYLKKYFRSFSKGAIFVITMGSIILTYGLSVWNGPVDMNTSNFGNNIFIYYLNGITGFTSVFGCSILLNDFRNNFVMYISFGTIMIIGLHNIITNGILNFLIELYLNVDIIKYSLLEGTGLALFSLLLFYFPIRFSKKNIPSLLGKR